MLSHFSSVQLCVTTWTAACQAPLAKGSSKQEYWSGLLWPPPEDLPDAGIKPMSLTSNLYWQAGKDIYRAQPRGATPRPRSGAEAGSARLWRRRSSPEELPPPKARGGGQEELPHVQGAVAARAHECLEEPYHIQGQERRRWGDTPHPR